jgi:hypothetical protein
MAGSRLSPGVPKLTVCARRDCSRLRRSSCASLRTAIAIAPASNFACGEVVELGLFVCREFELRPIGCMALLAFLDPTK